jgi:hypothetical protein
MANCLGFQGPIAAAGLVLGCLAVAPAHAQFMSGTYPVVIVPPPPAQGMVMPKRPKPPPPPAPSSQPPPDAPHQLTCRYQGQTRVCE